MKEQNRRLGVCPNPLKTYNPKLLRFPYRLCLAGGWVDQPWVSQIHPGSVVVTQIWPTQEFNDRSGLATSSRKTAVKMWGDRSPEGDPVTNAKNLFEAENPPGTRYVSGSQDHIGLLVPGVNRLDYSGDYWPQRIETTVNPDICEWLSSAIWMVPIAPRPEGYDPLETKDLREDWVKTLGEAGNLCYKSILMQDVHGLGESMSQTFLMWRMILPHTVPDHIFNVWETYSDYPGAVTSGCGGGYLLVASDRPVENAIQIKVKYEISKEEIQD